MLTSNTKHCDCKKSRYSSTSSDVKSCCKITKKLPCVIEAVGNSMLPDIRSVTYIILDNVVNFTPCIADQFSGAIFNKVISWYR